MKEIKAYIRNEVLDPVVNGLAHIEGLSGISVSTITGFGRSRGILRFVNFETHNKIEIVCHDDLAPVVVETIIKHAQTRCRGDGKIFISPVEESVRIETGACNEA